VRRVAAGRALQTLPDYLRPGLLIVSIGLNPSLVSARRGFYFANPRNRFWSALDRSGLVDEALEPGKRALERLFERHAIGFTDLVKRPTAGLADLGPEDFRAGAPALRDKLERCAPRITWFHGKVTYRRYRQHADGARGDFALGLQPAAIGRARVFVTPSPSPANAAVSLEELVDWYRRLKALRDSLTRSCGGSE
jgi:TDG/mug DNA glycosylase family protein